MTHEQATELLEAYSLGTIEPAEQAEVDRHLDECAECRARLRELSELSAVLAESVPQHDPPKELEERVMAQAKGGVSSKTKSAPVKGGSWFGQLGWIASAAAALIAVYFGLDQLQMQDQLRTMERELSTYQSQVTKLQADLAAYEDATMLLGEPGMQFVDLAGVDPNPQAFGKVVVDPERGNAVVYMFELPPTPDGMEYQLWVMREGKPTSAGTFSVANDGSAVLSLESVPDVSDIASFDVTIEPAGGQAEPTGMMYLTTPSVLQFDD